MGQTASDNIQKLITTVVQEHPLHQQFIKAACEDLNGKELAELDDYLSFLTASGLDIPYLADCYLTIVEDTLSEQLYFQKHKKYRYNSLDDVADKVYFDAEYMNKYMYGLAITNFLWPNHVAMVRFFKETLPKQDRGVYLEIGPGHGHFMITAMRLGCFSNYLGVDLSQTSVDQTRTMVQHFAPETFANARFEIQDFLAVSDLQEGSYDAIVMGEVLEHVEEPQRFLARIGELAKPGAYIFITTCINAPAVDHIYLWRTIDSLEEMITGSGLQIEESVYLPYTGKTLDEAKIGELPINVAYRLSKVL
jgi:2-polyprenyl-3-methyl-5-hydroxy-6-metoxy-1,4-benzoquinol methylase